MYVQSVHLISLKCQLFQSCLFVSSISKKMLVLPKYFYVHVITLDVTLHYRNKLQKFKKLEEAAGEHL